MGGKLAVALFLTAMLAAAPAQSLDDDPVSSPGVMLQPPPTPPPIQTRDVTNAPIHSPKGASIQYSIGQPSDEEQLYLEFVNRSRANPPAEGLRCALVTDPDILSAYAYFGVDLNLMQSQFNAISAVPPLAMNSKLMAAARLHSGDMFTNQFQAHSGTDGSDPGTRMSAQGYTWNTYGENIYAYSKSSFYGHAGLNVDWGPGTGGMQTPAGHRINIHFASFREVGIGIVDGVNGSVGPQVVTEDFAAQSTTPFITGVVYYDFNGNGFYDVGEGIGGVTVDVAGSSYYAITANSGGFAVPVTTNGIYTVTFSAPGLTSIQKVATVSGSQNVKIDYVPVYVAPAISGPNPAALNQTNHYTFPAVGAAVDYQVEQTILNPYATVEGAESGLGNVTTQLSSGYSVQISDLVASGSFAFHLAQPVATLQTLALNAVLRPATNTLLTFAKRLGWATSSQIARAQVSTNNGTSWQDVWSQPGNGASGDASFVRLNISLGAFAAIPLQVRFAYDYAGTSFFPQTNSNVGLCLDDIAVSNADQLQSSTISDVPNTNSFVLIPASTNRYLLRVRPILPGRTLDWGPASLVSVAMPAPTITISQSAIVSGQVQLEFSVANYRTLAFQLWQAPDPAGPWIQNTSATLQTLAAGSSFRLTAPSGGATKMFYRVKGTY